MAASGNAESGSGIWGPGNSLDDAINSMEMDPLLDELSDLTLDLTMEQRSLDSRQRQQEEEEEEEEEEVDKVEEEEEVVEEMEDVVEEVEEQEAVVDEVETEEVEEEKDALSANVSTE